MAKGRTRPRPGVWWVAAALAVLPALGADRARKPAEPFYRRYLNPADPLDQRILEQEKRVEADPKSAALRNDFGNLLAERRFAEQAREEYETALELDREHFLAAYNLGMLWESEGSPRRAITAYRKAIARKPGFPAAHFRLGRLYEQRGWNRMAIAEYARALRIDPGMRDPRVNPLVADSRLLDLVSLENYPRDIASAALKADAGYAEPWRFRPTPVDRPLSSDEISDSGGPEIIETRAPTPRAGIRAPAPPAAAGGRPAIPPNPAPPPEPVVEIPEEEPIPPEEMPHPPPFEPTPGR
jgi:tetratricopeptide (TPR) repeat protein